MNDFMLSLASLTTLLNPFMTFMALLAFIFFILFLKDKINNMEKYIQGIAISLQQISSNLSKYDKQ
ncbi:MAG: hypothetical protein ACOWWR_15830 [Eubacteriales bacterium]